MPQTTIPTTPLDHNLIDPDNFKHNAQLLHISKDNDTMEQKINSIEAAFYGPHFKSFLKDCGAIQEFKRKTKQRNGDSCTCRLCRVFIKDLELLDLFISL